MNHISVLMCSAAVLALWLSLLHSLAVWLSEYLRVIHPELLLYLPPSSSHSPLPCHLSSLPPSQSSSHLPSFSPPSQCCLARFSLSLSPHSYLNERPPPCLSPCVSCFTQSVEEEDMLCLSNRIHRQPECIINPQYVQHQLSAFRIELLHVTFVCSVVIILITIWWGKTQ